MKKNAQVKVTASASIDVGDGKARIEKLSGEENGREVIRLSTWLKEGRLPQPLVLSEEELVELLHKAIHARVLSQGFLGKLRERIEI